MYNEFEEYSEYEIDIEEINGIGLETAKELNTIGIRTTEDVRRNGWQKIAGIKHLGSGQVQKIANASGINIGYKEIAEYRDKLQVQGINKTELKYGKTVPSKNPRIVVNPTRYEYGLPFDELTPEQQEKAIEHMRGLDDVDNVSSEIISESFHNDLDEMCLPHDNVYFNLSYAQGDYVVFEGTINNEAFFDKYPATWDDLDPLIKLVEKYKEYAPDDNDDLLDYLDIDVCLSSSRESMYVSLEYPDLEWLFDTLVEFMVEYEEEAADEDAEVDEDDVKIMLCEEVGLDDESDIETIMRELENYIEEVVDDARKELERNGYSIIDNMNSDESIKETIEANDYHFDENGELV